MNSRKEDLEKLRRAAAADEPRECVGGCGARERDRAEGEVLATC
jgi:hypothetical protein